MTPRAWFSYLLWNLDRKWIGLFFDVWSLHRTTEP